MKIDINEGSYSYTIVLNDWVCEAELYSYGDNIVECLDEIFESSFVSFDSIETITINNYMAGENYG